MATTDIERLIVSLEASTKKYESALARANSETDKRVRSMQSRFDRLGATVARTETQMVRAGAGIGRAFGMLGLAFGAKAVIDMTASWTDLNSQIVNAVGSIDKGSAIMDRLIQVSDRTYSSLQQTAEGYLRNQQALSAMGYSTQQQLDLMETLNDALVISATRGQEAQSVLDAWSKAMALGELRGDNLNTIIQKGGRLSKALADSMGVSVNQLRKLGEQGKITSTAMFGVTTQLEQLQAEADAMPATVTDAMTRLGNAALVFVGEADKAAAGSTRLAEAIIMIADAIKQAPEQSWFDKFFTEGGDKLGAMLERDAKDLALIGRALEYLSSHSAGDIFDDILAGMKGVKDEVPSYEAAFGEAEQAVAAMALNTKGRFGEVDDAFQDLVKQILEGRGTVKSANEAIVALGEVDPSFHKMQDKIAAAITWFINLRDAANAATAAAQATDAVGAFPSWRQVTNQFGPDLSKDGGKITPQAPRSGGKSAGDKFQDALDQQKRRTEMLIAETKARAELNPLVNDYGYALEKLRTQQELENAATKNGLALTDERKNAIVELAEGYAQATAQAARLQEQQERVREGMDEWLSLGREVTKGFISDLVQGTSAAEALSNALGRIGDKLLDLSLDALFSSRGGSGFNPLGFLGSLFGFSSGTANTGGRRGEARGVVHGQEAVIPLPSGGQVPVELRMPSIIGSGGAQQVHVTVGVSADSSGNLTPFVESVAQKTVAQATPSIVSASVSTTNKQTPGVMATYQQQRGGSDYRV